MKKLIFLFCALCASHLFAQQEGTLDGNFDSDGLALVNIPNYSEAVITAIAVRPDGKIVAVGLATNDTTNVEETILLRFNPDGELDYSFGADNKGFIFYDFYKETKAILVMPTGAILTGGTTLSFTGAEQDFVMGGFSAEGFESEATYTGCSSNFGQGVYATITGMAVQPDGNIVVAGNVQVSGGTHDFGVARYVDVDTTPDSTFSFDGQLTSDFAGGNDLAHAVAVQPNGKIVVVGVTVSGGISKLALARYNANGSLDNSFGTSGKVVTEISLEAGLNDVKIQPDGKIVATGYAFGNGQFNGIVVRYLSNGNLDTSFGNGGVITVSDAFFRSLELQTNGKIVTAGSHISSDKFVVMRFNQNGQTDNSFGFNGLGEYVFFGQINDIAIQPNGDIVAAGYVSGFTKQLAIARYVGTFTSGTINPLAASTETLIYPNPVPAEATFGFELESAAEVSLSIMDIYGKVLQQPLSKSNFPVGKQEVSLSLGDLVPGNYLLVLQAGAHVVTTKFIKN
jgi:uncharacterized delta-60 repeat protein